MNDKIENIVQYWLDSSNRNYDTMQSLFKTKEYSWSLFIGHLVLEKLLKAQYVRTFKKHAPFTHDLLRLVDKLELNITEEQVTWLDEITTFNLNTRYDNYKHDFYKICNREFTEEWYHKIESLRTWLMKQL